MLAGGTIWIMTHGLLDSSQDPRDHYGPLPGFSFAGIMAHGLGEQHLSYPGKTRHPQAGNWPAAIVKRRGSGCW